MANYFDNPTDDESDLVAEELDDTQDEAQEDVDVDEGVDVDLADFTPVKVLPVRKPTRTRANSAISGFAELLARGNGKQPAAQSTAVNELPVDDIEQQLAEEKARKSILLRNENVQEMSSYMGFMGSTEPVERALNLLAGKTNGNLLALDILNGDIKATALMNRNITAEQAAMLAQISEEHPEIPKKFILNDMPYFIQYGKDEKAISAYKENRIPELDALIAKDPTNYAFLREAPFDVVEAAKIISTINADEDGKTFWGHIKNIGSELAGNIEVGVKGLIRETVASITDAALTIPNFPSLAAATYYNLRKMGAEHVLEKVKSGKINMPETEYGSEIGTGYYLKELDEAEKGLLNTAEVTLENKFFDLPIKEIEAVNRRAAHYLEMIKATMPVPPQDESRFWSVWRSVLQNSPSLALTMAGGPVSIYKGLEAGKKVVKLGIAIGGAQAGIYGFNEGIESTVATLRNNSSAAIPTMTLDVLSAYAQGKIESFGDLLVLKGAKLLPSTWRRFGGTGGFRATFKNGAVVKDTLRAVGMSIAVENPEELLQSLTTGLKNTGSRILAGDPAGAAAVDEWNKFTDEVPEILLQTSMASAIMGGMQSSVAIAVNARVAKGIENKIKALTEHPIPPSMVSEMFNGNENRKDYTENHAYINAQTILDYYGGEEEFNERRFRLDLHDTITKEKLFELARAGQEVPFAYDDIVNNKLNQSVVFTSAAQTGTLRYGRNWTDWEAQQVKIETARLFNDTVGRIVDDTTASQDVMVKIEAFRNQLQAAFGKEISDNDVLLATSLLVRAMEIMPEQLVPLIDRLHLIVGDEATAQDFIREYEGLVAKQEAANKANDALAEAQKRQTNKKAERARQARRAARQAAKAAKQQAQQQQANTPPATPPQAAPQSTQTPSQSTQAAPTAQPATPPPTAADIDELQRKLDEANETLKKAVEAKKANNNRKNRKAVARAADAVVAAEEALAAAGEALAQAQQQATQTATERAATSAVMDKIRAAIAEARTENNATSAVADEVRKAIAEARAREAEAAEATENRATSAVADAVRAAIAEEAAQPSANDKIAELQRKLDEARAAEKRASAAQDANDNTTTRKAWMQANNAVISAEVALEKALAEQAAAQPAENEAGFTQDEIDELWEESESVEDLQAQAAAEAEDADLQREVDEAKARAAAAEAELAKLRAELVARSQPATTETVDETKMSKFEYDVFKARNTQTIGLNSNQGGNTTKVQFVIVEMDDLLASHTVRTVTSFPDNPLIEDTARYPSDDQTRNRKGDPNLIQQVNKPLDPEYVVNNGKTFDGVPIVVQQQDENGAFVKDNNRNVYLVMGGNGRTMMIERNYNDENLQWARVDYKNYLKNQLDMFGMSAENVDGNGTNFDSFAKPVLVRLIQGNVNLDDYRNIVARLNTADTYENDRNAEIKESAARLKNAPETLKLLVAFGQENETLTLEQYIKKRSASFFEAMSKDGLLVESNKSRYANMDKLELNKDGIKLLQDAVLGTVLDNLDSIDWVMKNTAIANKMFSVSIYALSTSDVELEKLARENKTNAPKGYDLSEFIKQVVPIIKQISGKRKGKRDAWNVLKRTKFMFETNLNRKKVHIDPKEIDFAEWFYKTGVRKISERLRAYAANARKTVDAQDSMFGDEFTGNIDTPEQAFDKLVELPNKKPTNAEPVKVGAAVLNQTLFDFDDDEDAITYDAMATADKKADAERVRIEVEAEKLKSEINKVDAAAAAIETNQVLSGRNQRLTSAEKRTADIDLDNSINNDDEETEGEETAKELLDAATDEEKERLAEIDVDFNDALEIGAALDLLREKITDAENEAIEKYKVAASDLKAQWEVIVSEREKLQESIDEEIEDAEDAIDYEAAEEQNEESETGKREIAAEFADEEVEEDDFKDTRGETAREREDRKQERINTEAANQLLAAAGSDDLTVLRKGVRAKKRTKEQKAQDKEKQVKGIPAGLTSYDARQWATNVNNTNGRFGLVDLLNNLGKESNEKERFKTDKNATISYLSGLLSLYLHAIEHGFSHDAAVKFAKQIKRGTNEAQVNKVVDEVLNNTVGVVDESFEAMLMKANVETLRNVLEKMGVVWSETMSIGQLQDLIVDSTLNGQGIIRLEDYFANKARQERDKKLANDNFILDASLQGTVNDRGLNQTLGLPPKSGSQVVASMYALSLSRYLIRLSKNATPSSFIHELVHVITIEMVLSYKNSKSGDLRFIIDSLAQNVDSMHGTTLPNFINMTNAFLGNVNKSNGFVFDLNSTDKTIKDGSEKFVKQMENIAVMFERYLILGKAPDISLQGAFTVMQNRAAEIARGLKKGLFELPPDDLANMGQRTAILTAFDLMIAGVDKIKEVQGARLAISKMIATLKIRLNKPKGYSHTRASRMWQSAHRDLWEKVALRMRKSLYAGDKRFRKVYDQKMQELARQPDYLLIGRFKETVDEGGINSVGLAHRTISLNEIPAGIERGDIEKHGIIVNDDNSTNTQLIAIAQELGISPDDVLISIASTMRIEDAAVMETAQEVSAHEIDDSVKLANDDLTVSEDNLNLLIYIRNSLLSQTGVPSTSAEIVRQAAREALSRVNILNARNFRKWAAQELDSANKAVAALQSGNDIEAADHLDMQMLKHALQLEAINARDTLQKLERDNQPTRLARTLKRMDATSQQVLRWLTMFYGLQRKADLLPFIVDINLNVNNPELSVSEKAILLAQTKGDFDAFYQKMQVMFDPMMNTPQFIAEDFAKYKQDRNAMYKEFRSLTYGQIMQLNNFINAIKRNGKQIKSGVQAGKQMVTNAKGEKILDGLDTLISNRRKGKAPTTGDVAADVKVKTAWEKIQHSIRKVLGYHELMENLFDAIDGFTFARSYTHGTMGRLFADIQDGEAKAVAQSNAMWERFKKSEIPSKLRAMEKRLNKKFGDSRFVINGLPQLQDFYVQNWTAQSLIAAMLNTGNRFNIHALTYGWGNSEESDVGQQKRDAWLKTLRAQFTAQEHEVFQEIGDILGSVFKEFRAVNLELTGLETEEQYPLPATFVSEDGKRIKSRGWYYPLVYEPRTSKGNISEAQMQQQNMNNQSLPNNNNGISRMKTTLGEPVVTRPPLLEFTSVIDRHIKQVTRRINTAIPIKNMLKIMGWQEFGEVEVKDDKGNPVIDALGEKLTKRIPTGRNFKKSFIEAFGEEYWNQLEQWIFGVANPDTLTIQDGGLGAGVLRYTQRTNFVFGLGAKATAALVQASAYVAQIFYDARTTNMATSLKYLMIAQAKLAFGRFSDGRGFFAGKRESEKLSVQMSTRTNNLGGLLTHDLPDSHKIFDRLRIDIGDKTLTVSDIRNMFASLISVIDGTVNPIGWWSSYLLAMNHRDKNGNGVNGIESSMPLKDIQRKAIEYADNKIRLTQPDQRASQRNAIQRSAFMRALVPFMGYAFRQLGNYTRDIGAVKYKDKNGKRGMSFRTFMGNTIGGGLFVTIVTQLLRAAGDWYEDKDTPLEDRVFDGISDQTLGQFAFGSNITYFLMTHQITALMPNPLQYPMKEYEKIRRNYEEGDPVATLGRTISLVSAVAALPVGQAVDRIIYPALRKTGIVASKATEKIEHREKVKAVNKEKLASSPALRKEAQEKKDVTKKRSAWTTHYKSLRKKGYSIQRAESETNRKLGTRP